MTTIIAVGLLLLLAGKSQAQTGYFPLQVGNRWIYNEQRVPYNQDEDPVEELGTHELAITGTVRIAPDFPRGVWAAELSPSAPEGRLYHVLEGKRILQLIALRPSPYDESRQLPNRFFFDALLVREAGTLDGVYDDEERIPDLEWLADYRARGGEFGKHFRDSVLEYGPRDLIVAGGGRDERDGRWILFEKDVPYWYLSTEPRSFSVAALEVGGEVEIWYDFDSTPQQDSLIVDIMAGDRQYINSHNAYIEATHLYSSRFWFAEDVGITRIRTGGQWAYRILDLVGFVRGSDKTSVRALSWGRLKEEVLRDEEDDWPSAPDAELSVLD